MENPEEVGLIPKYNITKTNGNAIDPKAKYFILRYDTGQKDSVHADACRKALATYADMIESHLPLLAKDLRKLVPEYSASLEFGPEFQGEKFRDKLYIESGAKYSMWDRFKFLFSTRIKWTHDVYCKEIMPAHQVSGKFTVYYIWDDVYSWYNRTFRKNRGMMSSPPPPTKKEVFALYNTKEEILLYREEKTLAEFEEYNANLESCGSDNRWLKESELPDDLCPDCNCRVVDGNCPCSEAKKLEAQAVTLTKDNIEEWKVSLNKKMKERYQIDNYALCLPDPDWLKEYEGSTDEDAISDEIESWDD